jgi:hypothetical protein
MATATMGFSGLFVLVPVVAVVAAGGPATWPALFVGLGSMLAQ